MKCTNLQITVKLILAGSFFVLLQGTVLANERVHPNLTVTQSEVDTIKSELKQVPSAVTALEQLTTKVDSMVAEAIVVPLPEDAGGGYTHEQHKRNYLSMYNAALLFQLTDNSKYQQYVTTMLLEYAKLYPTLGLHPKQKEQTPGKLFWQSLNEAMWLVYTIQAYDLIAGSLSDDDRNTIETNLLRPIANYLSAGQPQTFNKIHNHGTWAAAAVGMTGYVLDDETLVKQALYGLDMSGDAGFLQQINQLFSPDGYYAEGPYYQRFALLPFVLFSKAIEVNNPELNIFSYHDNALLKAIETTVQLSYNKLFFGINDAIKDKGVETIELVHGIAIAYDITKNTGLLSIAELQNQTLLTGYGFKVAKALDNNLATPFEYRSMQLRDGTKGDQGALAIFRNGVEYGHQALVMKNTSQGLGHGHFDKLHWLYFDNGNEIVSDYGAARFLNIEAKYGGHYLPENNAWAKQTIAHNTLVVDEQSHFYGDFPTAQKSYPKVDFFEATEGFQITSASIGDAYKDTGLRRTMAMIKTDSLEYPLIVDIFDVSSSSKHQYDLPLYYQGHIMSHTVDFDANDKNLTALGDNNGYQYLWDRGHGNFDGSMGQVTWLKDDRFYTYSVVGGEDQKMIFAQIGANDPNYNLRNENALIHRVSGANDHSFVSILETHGEYNGTAEFTIDAVTSVASVTSSASADADVVTINLVDGSSLTLAVAYSSDEDQTHSVTHQGKEVQWVGSYSLIKE